jgi:carboxyl-terminal processing protease
MCNFVLRRLKFYRERTYHLATLAILLAHSAIVNSQQQLPLPLEEVRMFTDALDQIRSSYVEDVKDQDLLESAIRGMLIGLDPHSAFISGADFDSLQDTTTGEFGGLGIEVSRQDDYILVISPIDGSPADRAGILPGDRIMQINGKPLRQLLPDEAAELMRGAPGTKVSVTISREGLDPFELQIIRDIVSINSVRSRIINQSYAYVRISQFRGNTGAEFQNEIEQLIKGAEPIYGLILDLRNNPGGVVQSAVEIVDSFIDNGTIVYTEGRIEQANNKYLATKKSINTELPIVVLINRGSASASEIVAGALQDHNRAIILGTRSFGKGSVQTILPLAPDKAMKLTTSLYFTPNGRSIQATGIVPDVIVEEAFITKKSRDIRQYVESDLEGHIPSVNKLSKNEQRTQLEGRDDLSSGELSEVLVTAEEVLVSDYPLQEALNLLKGINSYMQGQ